jgi:hypothetical protein
MEYSEFNRDFENGLIQGELILKLDRTRERTYAKLMRLHYQMGDRAGAVRLFQRCVAALKQELDVAPARKTSELYEQIRTDQLDIPLTACADTPSSAGYSAAPALVHYARSLERIRSILLHLRQCVQQDLELVNDALAKPGTQDQVTETPSVEPLQTH